MKDYYVTYDWAYPMKDSDITEVCNRKGYTLVSHNITKKNIFSRKRYKYIFRTNNKVNIHPESHDNN